MMSFCLLAFTATFNICKQGPTPSCVDYVSHKGQEAPNNSANVRLGWKYLPGKNDFFTNSAQNKNYFKLKQIWVENKDWMKSSLKLKSHDL